MILPEELVSSHGRTVSLGVTPAEVALPEDPALAAAWRGQPPWEKCVVWVWTFILVEAKLSGFGVVCPFDEREAGLLPRNSCSWL